MNPEIPLLDLKAQFRSLRREIERAVQGVLESQSFILGPVVERFEDEAARYLGVPHAIGCASGTDALILSLAALGVGPGDEVLTTPFSFFSTASCAYKVGARPVFSDIDPATFNLDPGRMPAVVSPRTRAILPVHLFGQCAEMDPIVEIAEHRGLPVVEDAAQALGATYESARRGGGRAQAGCLGILGCYSFFPTKNLGCLGDGGLIATSDGPLAERLRCLRVHGETDKYHHRYVGWNSRLDAMQAAVLSVKLQHLDAWSGARRANAARYDHLLEDSGLLGTGRLRVPGRSTRSTHIFNQYTLRVTDRDALRQHLRERRVGHAVYYPVPLHLQECFRELGYREGDFPEAERASREVISLPIYPELDPAQQQQVVDAIVEFYAGR